MPISRQAFFQIGINYFGQDTELQGCVNDANNMREFLCSEQELRLSYRLTLFIVSEECYGYKRGDIVMLTDDSTNPRMMPTKENIVRCFVSIICVLSNSILLSWKQCIGLCAMLRPMMLYFSIVSKFHV